MLKLKGEIHIVPEIAQMPVKVIPNIAPRKDREAFLFIFLVPAYLDIFIGVFIKLCRKDKI